MKTLFHHTYQVQEENGKYRPLRFSDAQLEGLHNVLPAFRKYAQCAAGISVKCTTDAAEIAFSYVLSIPYTRHSWFDVYENGVLMANPPLPEQPGEHRFVYRKQTEGEILLEIFLPAGSDLTLWDFSLGNWKLVSKAKGKPLLFYGDSLTQSAYTANPSLSFAGLTAAALGLDYLNRGVGSLFYDETWLVPDGIDPAAVIVAFGANDLVAHNEKNDCLIKDGKSVWCTEADVPMLMKKAKAALQQMQRVYPNARILVLTLLSHCMELPPERVRAEKAYNKALAALIQELGLEYVDGSKLMPHIPASHYSDMLHLSQFGGAMIARSLASYLNV